MSQNPAKLHVIIVSNGHISSIGSKPAATRYLRRDVHEEDHYTSSECDFIGRRAIFGHDCRLDGEADSATGEANDWNKTSL